MAQKWQKVMRTDNLRKISHYTTGTEKIEVKYTIGRYHKETSKIIWYVREGIHYESLFEAKYKIREVSPDQALEIILTRQPTGRFFHLTSAGCVGIDNTTGDAWTEEFKSLKKCLRWLAELDAEPDHN